MKEKIRTLQVGKYGLTENVLGEIKTQLKAHRFLKVRILKTAKGKKNTKQLAEEVAEHTDSKVIDVRGNTFILEKT